MVVFNNEFETKENKISTILKQSSKQEFPVCKVSFSCFHFIQGVSFFFRTMEWTNQHDKLFLRDVRASDLWATRKGSPERGKVWDKIAESLNSLSLPKFYVNKRSLRDRLNLLMSKFKAKNREEEKASGISPEVQEIDTLLEEVCEKEEEAKKQPLVGEKKQKQEKAKAEEMRLKAMETMGQTQKRGENSDGVPPTKKKRKSTGDAIGYLEKKSEQELELRREEIEMRRQEEVRGSQLSEQQSKMQQDMLKIIQQQQEEQQKQQQRFQQQQMQFMQTVFNQQQQQSQALLALFERLAPKST